VLIALPCVRTQTHVLRVDHKAGVLRNDAIVLVWSDKFMPLGDFFLGNELFADVRRPVVGWRLARASESLL